MMKNLENFYLDKFFCASIDRWVLQGRSTVTNCKLKGFPITDSVLSREKSDYDNM